MNMKLGLISLMLFATVFAQSSDTTNESEWRMFKRFLNHTGFYNNTTPSKLHPNWTYTTDNMIFASPIIADDKLFIGTESGTMYALDLSGNLLWTYSTGANIRGSVAFADGIIFFGSLDNHIYALNASDGSQLWNYSTGNYVYSSPAVYNGRVYVGSLDGYLYVLNSSDGSQIWNFSTNGTIYSSPLIVDDIVYTTDNGTIYALNATDGNLIWNTTLDANSQHYSSLAYAYGLVYAGTYFNKTMYALNATDGSIVWNYTVGGYISYPSPSIAYGMVYFGSYDEYTYALNATDGSFVWRTLTGDTFSSPAIADGKVYVGSNNGKLYVLDAYNGNIISSYQTGGPIVSSPSIANGIIFVGSYDTKIYALRQNNIPNVSNVTLHPVLNETHLWKNFVVNCMAYYEDPDNDTGNVTFRFYLNDTLITSVYAIFTDVPSGSWVDWPISTVPQYFVGSNFTCSAQATDGIDNSTEVNSSSHIVANLSLFRACGQPIVTDGLWILNDTVVGSPDINNYCLYNFQPIELDCQGHVINTTSGSGYIFYSYNTNLTIKNCILDGHGSRISTYYNTINITNNTFTATSGSPYAPFLTITSFIAGDKFYLLNNVFNQTNISSFNLVEAFSPARDIRIENNVFTSSADWSYWHTPLIILAYESQTARIVNNTFAVYASAPVSSAMVTSVSNALIENNSILTNNFDSIINFGYCPDCQNNTGCNNNWTIRNEDFSKNNSVSSFCNTTITHCGTLLPYTNYTLGGDVVAHNNSCIILAYGNTVDCLGYTIKGESPFYPFFEGGFGSSLIKGDTPSGFDSNNTISNCHFANASEAGALTFGGDNVRIFNNTFFNVSGGFIGGIHPFSGTIGPAIGWNISVFNNSIDCTGIPLGGISGGFVVIAENNSKIYDNQFNNCVWGALLITEKGGLDAYNNTITNGLLGFAVIAPAPNISSRNATIYNNSFFDTNIPFWTTSGFGGPQGGINYNTNFFNNSIISVAPSMGITTLVDSWSYGTQILNNFINVSGVVGAAIQFAGMSNSSIAKNNVILNSPMGIFGGVDLGGFGMPPVVPANTTNSIAEENYINNSNIAGIVFFDTPYIQVKSNRIYNASIGHGFISLPFVNFTLNLTQTNISYEMPINETNNITITEPKWILNTSGSGLSAIQIYIQKTGISLVNITGATVENNIINMTTIGIHLLNVTNSIIRNNRVYSANTTAGILLENFSNNNRLLSNLVTNSTVTGFVLNDSNANELSGNDGRFNGNNSGFYLTNTTSNNYGCPNQGTIVDEGTNNNVQNNCIPTALGVPPCQGTTCYAPPKCNLSFSKLYFVNVVDERLEIKNTGFFACDILLVVVPETGYKIYPLNFSLEPQEKQVVYIQAGVPKPALANIIAYAKPTSSQFYKEVEKVVLEEITKPFPLLYLLIGIVILLIGIAFILFRRG